MLNRAVIATVAVLLLAGWAHADDLPCPIGPPTAKCPVYFPGGEYRTPAREYVPAPAAPPAARSDYRLDPPPALDPPTPFPGSSIGTPVWVAPAPGIRITR